MSRRRDEDSLLESLKSFVEKLNKGADIIIVEGIKDRKALKGLGIKAKILTLYELKTKEREVKGKRVVILTDFDEKGKELKLRVERMLVTKGARIVREYRRELARFMFKRKMKEIESLASLASTLEKRLITWS